MANEKGNVKLLSYWFSPYCKRVELALNAKGIAFEYQEEDVSNKSELLLKLNPVLKKVPVLIHNGKPFCESLIILEYIDETWTNSPKLLPQDPPTRAKFRFWAHFINGQLLDGIFPVFTSTGKEQEKAYAAFYANVKLLEDGISTDFFGTGKRQEIKQEDLNLVDVVLWSVLGGFEVYESMGFKILDSEEYPLTHSWVTKLNNLPMVKKTAVDSAKIVSEIKFYQNMASQQAPPPSS